MKSMKTPLKNQLAEMEKETGINRNYLRDILAKRKRAGVKTARKIVKAKTAQGRWTLGELRPDLVRLAREVA